LGMGGKYGKEHNHRGPHDERDLWEGATRG
jgi:hypothetical protein